MPEERHSEEKRGDKPKVELIEEVLGNILEVHLRLNEISYTNASFLIAAAGIILTLIIAEVLPNIKELNTLAKAGIAILALSSLASLAINIEIIDPRIGKKIKRKNLFYYRSFLDHYSADDYAKELSKLIKSEDYIVEQYAKEIYDLGKHVLEPKFRLLKLAARILIAGVVLGSLIIFASVIVR